MLGAITQCNVQLVDRAQYYVRSYVRYYNMCSVVCSIM